MCNLVHCLSISNYNEYCAVYHYNEYCVVSINNYNGVLYFQLQDEIRAAHGVWEREVTKQRNLDRVKFRDPANRKRIVSSSVYISLSISILYLCPLPISQHEAK